VRPTLIIATAIALLLLSSATAEAVPAREWGFSISTNFASLLPIGLLQELAAAPVLVGAGGYGRFEWIWGLHARPWAQFFPADDRNRFAGGFDLIWGDPMREPALTYVGFGVTVTDFLPLPITNFVLGYETGRDVCNFHFETRFLFVTSFSAGWGCGF